MGIMWFLIKGAFWFSIVLVALSFFGSDPGAEMAKGETRVEFANAFTAASGAIRYMGAICSEQPDVCEKGARTFAALSVRAREGAKVAYEMLDTYLDNKDGAKTETAALEDVTTATDENDPVGAIITGTVVPHPIPKPQR
jgi:hypothetical protein